jgi:AcrR family transcriptional regulator
MSRRPARVPARSSATSSSTGSNGDTPPEDTSPRGRIIHAFMALLAERALEEIGLAEIAARAGVSLSDLRGEFGSKIAILAAHVKDLDRKVLAGIDPEMAEEPARERLFDVLMRRLELMVPHKDATASLLRSAQRDPPLALALNGLAVRSQLWMLSAADIDIGGPGGMVRAQGLALLFARVLRTFVRDDDAGLARTMASLDRELGRGQRWVGMLDGLLRLSPTRCFGSRRRRRGEDDDEETVAA